MIQYDRDWDRMDMGGRWDVELQRSDGRIECDLESWDGGIIHTVLGI